MSATTLQTLDRGLLALSLLAKSSEGLRPAELAAKLDVHKAIAYRLVATLENHGVVRRLPDGRVVLGAALISLAAQAERHRLAVAAPYLAALSEATHATSCIIMADGPNAVVALVQEGGNGLLRVSYRLGQRHPLILGASGLAILAGRPEAPDDLPGVKLARKQGYSLTRGELQPGAIGIAAPIPPLGPDATPTDAAVAIVALQEFADDAAEQVISCARAIGAFWRSDPS